MQCLSEVKSLTIALWYLDGYMNRWIDEQIDRDGYIDT